MRKENVNAVDSQLSELIGTETTLDTINLIKYGDRRRMDLN